MFPGGWLIEIQPVFYIITNDGDLPSSFHPSYEVKKIYHATLNKPMSDEAS